MVRIIKVLTFFFLIFYFLIFLYGMCITFIIRNYYKINFLQMDKKSEPGNLHSTRMLLENFLLHLVDKITFPNTIRSAILPSILVVSQMDFFKTLVLNGGYLSF